MFFGGEFYRDERLISFVDLTSSSGEMCEVDVSAAVLFSQGLHTKGAFKSLNKQVVVLLAVQVKCFFTSFDNVVWSLAICLPIALNVIPRFRHCWISICARPLWNLLWEITGFRKFVFLPLTLLTFL